MQDQSLPPSDKSFDGTAKAINNSWQKLKHMPLGAEAALDHPLGPMTSATKEEISNLESAVNKSSNTIVQDGSVSGAFVVQSTQEMTKATQDQDQAKS